MEKLLSSVTVLIQEKFSLEVLSKLLVEGSFKVITAVTVLAIFYLVWQLILLILKYTLSKKLDKTSFSFFRTIVKFSLISIAVVSALDSIGIKTSAILTSLGVAGLTIGFAAKDALSNLISGVLIFIDRPFVLGDLVEIEGVYGQVERITLRSTRVVTMDGRMLAVPNTEVINKTVASYTNFPHLRIDIKVTVAPTENLERVRKLMFEVVKDDVDYMKEKPVRMVVTELNDYNVGLEFQAWIIDEKKHVQKRFELREKIFNTLLQNNVDMPCETFKLEPVTINSQKTVQEPVV